MILSIIGIIIIFIMFIFEGWPWFLGQDKAQDLYDKMHIMSMCDKQSDASLNRFVSLLTSLTREQTIYLIVCFVYAFIEFFIAILGWIFGVFFWVAGICILAQQVLKGIFKPRWDTKFGKIYLYIDTAISIIVYLMAIALTIEGLL